MPDSICEICFEHIDATDTNHLPECLNRQLKYIQQYSSSQEFYLCETCNISISLNQINEHEQLCQSYKCDKCNTVMTLDKINKHKSKCNLIILKEKYKDDTGMNNMTSKQIKALDYCTKKSRIFSKSVYGNLLVKIIELGFTENDLQQTLDYIKNTTEITINFNMESMAKPLSEDYKYKSRYEVHNLASFHGRDQWEDILFNRIYDHTALPGERVKYGALNITNYKYGGAKVYGDSFMVLKNHIKQRTTCTLGDSSKQEIHLCMPNNFCNILLYLDNASVTDIMNIAIGRTKTAAPTLEYIECQIHGDVIFARDVEMLVINSRHKNDPTILQYLKQFKRNNGVNYVWNE